MPRGGGLEFGLGACSALSSVTITRGALAPMRRGEGHVQGATV